MIINDTFSQLFSVLYLFSFCEIHFGGASFAEGVPQPPIKAHEDLAPSHYS